MQLGKCERKMCSFGGFFDVTRCLRKCSCRLPPSEGVACKVGKPGPRYAFNNYMDICTPMQYKGCGGNSNNFFTAMDCNTRCQGIAEQEGENIRVRLGFTDKSAFKAFVNGVPGMVPPNPTALALIVGAPEATITGNVDLPPTAVAAQINAGINTNVAMATNIGIQPNVPKQTVVDANVPASYVWTPNQIPNVPPQPQIPPPMFSQQQQQQLQQHASNLFHPGQHHQPQPMFPANQYQHPPTFPPNQHQQPPNANINPSHWQPNARQHPPPGWAPPQQGPNRPPAQQPNQPPPTPPTRPPPPPQAWQPPQGNQQPNQNMNQRPPPPPPRHQMTTPFPNQFNHGPTHPPPYYGPTTPPPFQPNNPQTNRNQRKPPVIERFPKPNFSLQQPPIRNKRPVPPQPMNTHWKRPAESMKNPSKMIAPPRPGRVGVPSGPGNGAGGLGSGRRPSIPKLQTPKRKPTTISPPGKLSKRKVVSKSVTKPHKKLQRQGKAFGIPTGPPSTNSYRYYSTTPGPFTQRRFNNAKTNPTQPPRYRRKTIQTLPPPPYRGRPTNPTEPYRYGTTLPPRRNNWGPRRW